MSILLPAFLVYFKPSQDILQGLSKLDYLCKVSVFQVVKRKSIVDDSVSGQKISVLDRNTGIQMDYSIDKLRAIGTEELIINDVLGKRDSERSVSLSNYIRNPRFENSNYSISSEVYEKKLIERAKIRQ